MPDRDETSTVPAELSIQRRADDTLALAVSGCWQGIGPGSHLAALRRELSRGPLPRRAVFEAADLHRWDSTLVVFVRAAIRLCRQHEVAMATDGLPTGVNRLLALSAAASEPAGEDQGRASKLAAIGAWTLGVWQAAVNMAEFLGQVTIAAGRFCRGRARFRWADLALTIHQSGPGALPIITTITFLSGLILAFVGSLQLRMFGAQIYVADLVGIGIVREMGAIMAAVVMAGRTGASFAAQLGTMQVNEELDAFTTMGISPIEFLVLPRIIGLTLMMPLLCVYADVMGILGGMFVGLTVLDLGFTEYVIQTREAITIADLCVGLVMSIVFGILIGLAGCLRGMRCGRSSDAVGEATTAAVVTSIVSIVIATAVITVLCDILGV